MSANFCDPPPDPETDGWVVARSTGNRFGKVCDGTDDEQPPVAFPSCPWMAVNYTQKEDGIALYNITVTTLDFRADRIFIKIRFDANITSINVTNY